MKGSSDAQRLLVSLANHPDLDLRLNGFGGCKQIAQTLARAGWKISKRSVNVFHS